MNSLAELLKDFKVAPEKEHAPALPQPTPKPERSKVMANPLRQPINRQAALILAPVRSWLSQPLPDEAPPTKESKEIAGLKNVLKTERNEHAVTRDKLGALRIKLSEYSALVAQLRLEVDRLKKEGAEKDSIIRQLEDLRL